jgi:hypothetical protein
MAYLKPSIKGQAMKDELTTFHIINTLGIDRGRLREWMKEGFILPSIKKADGVGTKALFDRIDIVALVLFKQLIDEHMMARKEAATIASLFSRTVHMFLDAAGEKILDAFLHGDRSELNSGWKRLRIGRKNAEFIVTSLVAFDLSQYIVFDEVATEKFKENLGGEDVFDSLIEESTAADSFMSGFKNDFTYVTVLNLRDIVAEARKVYDEG